MTVRRCARISRQKNVTVEQMAEAGLVISGDDIPVAYDRFRDRVMFPIRDPRGQGDCLWRAGLEGRCARRNI